MSYQQVISTTISNSCYHLPMSMVLVQFHFFPHYFSLNSWLFSTQNAYLLSNHYLSVILSFISQPWSYPRIVIYQHIHNLKIMNLFLRPSPPILADHPLSYSIPNNHWIYTHNQRIDSITFHSSLTLLIFALSFFPMLKSKVNANNLYTSVVLSHLP